MKKYACVDVDGNITGFQTGPDVDNAIAWGLYEVDNDVTEYSHYVIDGVVRTYTGAEAARRSNQPSKYHIWDTTTRSWFDTRTIVMLQDEKWNEIKRYRDQADAMPINYNGRVYDADPVSQAKIQGAALAAQLDGNYKVVWTLADNTEYTLVAVDVIKLSLAIINRSNQNHEKGRLLRDRIYACTTSTALLDIQW